MDLSNVSIRAWRTTQASDSSPQCSSSYWCFSTLARIRVPWGALQNTNALPPTQPIQSVSEGGAWGVNIFVKAPEGFQ